MMSTESDGYEATDSSASHRRGRPPSRMRHGRARTSSTSTAADQIDIITSDLKEANKNLHSVDSLLEHYNDVNDVQNSAIDRLRGNLARSTDRLRNERVRQRSPPLQGSSRRTLRASDLERTSRNNGRRYRTTSPLRDYRSEAETASTRTNRFRPSVRFNDNMDQIHEIHQTVRDLSSDQQRLGEELDMEVDRRNRTQNENRMSIQELSTTLQRSKHQDREKKSSDRVERRLRDIQDELRQQRLHRETRDVRPSVTREDRPPHTSTISAELREAVSSQTQKQERELREKLLHAEAEKQRLADRLENAQRQLDQTQGTNTALNHQLEGVQDRLARSDHERSEIAGKLSSYQEVLEEEGLPLSRQARRERKLQERQDKQDNDRNRLEIEIDSLRTQLGQASGLRELEQSRKELQRSEKQRHQLSQHLERLNKELEEKDRHQAKIVSRFQESSEQLRDAEQQRERAMAQLDEIQDRLRETSKVNSGQEDRLQDCQRRLEDSERKRTEMKTKAQETVRQWKIKCKKLEHEMGGTKQSTMQLLEKKEQLVKENETLKGQVVASSHRMETMQKEVNDILEKRAFQDEQVRVQDVEINKLKSVRKDLEQELRDTRSFMDKLDNELRTQQARYGALSEEKLRIEQDFGTSKSAQHHANKQLEALQGDIKELTLQQAELSARLAEETSLKHDAEDRWGEAKKHKNAAREELALLSRQLKESQELHNASMAGLQKELTVVKEREEKTMRDLLKRQKREKTELEAELQALKIELAEDRSSLKSVRRQLERSKTDYDHQHEEFNKMEDENVRLKRNFDRMRAEFEDQAQLAEVDGNRASMLERHRRQLEDKLREQGAEYETILRQITREIDILVHMLSTEKEDKYRTGLTPTKDVTGKPQQWLGDIKGKLYWLQEEIQNQLDSQNKLKENLNRSYGDMDEMLKSSGVEKIRYESQLASKDYSILDLKVKQQELAKKNLQKGEAVHSLERQVAQLEYHIESNAKALQKSNVATDQMPELDSLRAASPDEEFVRLKDLQRERDRINERYTRYRGTVTLLQEQLEEARRSTMASQRNNTHLKNSDRATNKTDVSPPRKRRVAFEESTSAMTSTPQNTHKRSSNYLSYTADQDIS